MLRCENEWKKMKWSEKDGKEKVEQKVMFIIKE